jgi:flagellar biosynthetic protein FliR
MSDTMALGGLGLSLGGGQVASLFLVLMRTTGLIVTAPILGHRAVPAPVKAGLAAVLAVSLARGAAIAPGALPVIIAAPIELLIGLCLGTVISMGFQAIELGGRLISLQMGLSLGAVFSPTSHEGGTPFDPFFSVLAGLLFLALDLHLAVVRALASSFTTLPIGGGWPTDLWLLAGQLIALALQLGTRIAMPVALVLLLTELAVALLARAIPTINVFILGLPLKITVGIAVAALALPNLAAGATSIYRFLLEGVTTGAIR